MKMIGAHVCSHVEMLSQEYHATAVGTWTCVVCESSVNSGASLPS
jgi:ribosomal protein L37AE/L43A